MKKKQFPPEIGTASPAGAAMSAIFDGPTYDPEALKAFGPDEPMPSGLTINESRLIGDLLGQKDAGIEMLNIRLRTNDGGKTIQCEFRTPLGRFAFNDCEVALDRSMAPLVGAVVDDIRLAKSETINVDRFAVDKGRKIKFD